MAVDAAPIATKSQRRRLSLCHRGRSLFRDTADNHISYSQGPLNLDRPMTEKVINPYSGTGGVCVGVPYSAYLASTMALISFRGTPCR